MRFWKMKEGIMTKLCCDGCSKVGSKTAPMEIISELRTLILSNNYFINKKKLNFRPRQGIIIITVVLNLTKR